MKKSNRFLKFLLTALGLLLLIPLSLYDGLVTRTYRIETPLVSEMHTFVHVSDLHATYYGERQEELIAAVARHNPEAVFLTGDIGHDRRAFDGTEVFLRAIAADFPCYYVTGNHERWVEYTDDIKALMRSCGVIVLDETAAPVLLAEGEIAVFGVDDPLFYEDVWGYCSALNRTNVRSAETFDILLAHRPEFFDIYRESGYDLALCGHAHGGQVRIPLLLNGLYAPNQGFFPEYAGGRYDENGQTMIVSRGLMKDDLPRVFNPPEVCVIEILPK